MAAGFRLAVGSRGGFESFLAERLGPLVPRGGVLRTLFIDGALTVAGADVTLMREPASCKKNRTIHAFPLQNMGFSDRSGVWLKFTASEDKPHA